MTTVERKLSQQQVLTQFFIAMNGDEWKVNQGWMTGQPIGEWAGVGVNQEGKVEAICLPANNLQGNLPTTLANLETLKVLDLRENLITGSIPRELGSLQNLRVLGLGNNLLTGQIPQEMQALRLEQANIKPNMLGDHPGYASYVGNLDESAKCIKVRSVHQGEINPQDATLLNMAILEKVIRLAEQDVLSILLEGNHESVQEINQAWAQLKAEKYPGLSGWDIQMDQAFCGYCRYILDFVQDTNCFHCEMPFQTGAGKTAR
jgi:hypothetical protein